MIALAARHIERIQLHRVSPTLAFAEGRLPGVNLHGLRVERRAGGTLEFRTPERQDSAGRTWPVYALQPGTREAVVAELARLWAVGDTRG